MRRLIWRGDKGTTTSWSADREVFARRSSRAAAKTPTSSRQSLAPAVLIGLRGAHAHAQAAGGCGGDDVAPAQAGHLGAPQAGAEQQGDDGGVLAAAGRRRRSGFRAAAGAARLRGEGEQPQDVLVGERGRLPGDGGVGMRGVLARDAGDGFAHDRGPGRVRPAVGEVDGPHRGRGDAHGAGPGRLGAHGEPSGDRVRGGGQRDGTALGAPGREAVPLRTVGAAGVVGARRGGGRGQAPAVVHREAVVRREAGCGGRGRGYALSDNGHYRTSMIHSAASPRSRSESTGSAGPISPRSGRVV